jgi:hypothetical protein
MPFSAHTLPNDIRISSISRRTSPGFISFDTLNTQDLLLFPTPTETSCSKGNKKPFTLPVSLLFQ